MVKVDLRFVVGVSLGTILSFGLGGVQAHYQWHPLATLAALTLVLLVCGYIAMGDGTGPRATRGPRSARPR